MSKIFIVETNGKLRPAPPSNSSYNSYHTQIHEQNYNIHKWRVMQAQFSQVQITTQLILLQFLQRLRLYLSPPVSVKFLLQFLQVHITNTLHWRPIKFLIQTINKHTHGPGTPPLFPPKIPLTTLTTVLIMFK